MKDFFARFAARTAKYVGSPFTFVLAVSAIVVWGISGPIFHFSQTWQLIINTGTTIITFLMVFIIQNSQNRDSKAIELKLNELIHKIKPARNSLIDLEELSEKEFDKLQKEFRNLSKKKIIIKS